MKRCPECNILLYSDICYECKLIIEHDEDCFHE